MSDGYRIVRFYRATQVSEVVAEGLTLQQARERAVSGDDWFDSYVGDGWPTP